MFEEEWQRNHVNEILLNREAVRGAIMSLVRTQMANQLMSRDTLGKMMGRTQGYITSTLNSSRRNTTIDEISDIAFALGCRLEVKFVPKDTPPTPPSFGL